MARQSGLVRYRGTLAGVRHYKIKGIEGDFAGMKGGVTGERIKTGPEFQRTRENMSEFSGCAAASKSVRMGLAEVQKRFSDPRVSARLTAVMKRINLLDETEARGERKILISTQAEHLFGFNFNKFVNFHQVMKAPYSLTHAVDRTTASWTIPAFLPVDYLEQVPGATHFRLVLAICVVSDFEYSSTVRGYVPVSPLVNEVGSVAMTDYLPLNAEYEGETLTAELVEGIVLTSDVSVLQCLAVEFFQKVGTNYYRLNENYGMVIDDVF